MPTLDLTGISISAFKLGEVQAMLAALAVMLVSLT